MARENTQFLYLISSMIVLILIIGCAPSAPAKSPGYSTTGQSLDGPEFKKAESKSQLIAFLRQSEQSQNIANYGGARREVAVMAFDADVPLGAPQAKSAVMSEESSAGNDGAGSYSSTNIQVAGVDEADFVKNDGKYIYTIVQDSVVIVEAYPSNEAKIVSQIKLNGTPQQMFLNGDRLAVFLSGWEEVPIIAQYDFMPRPAAKSLTHALIYDVSDRSDPELIKDYDIKGNYYGSRMIGGIAYLIVQDYVYYADSYLDTPVLRESGKIVFAPDIYYPTVPSQNYNFNTIMSIDLSDDGAAPSAKTFMTGYSSTLYVSQDAIYLSSPKEQSYGYYEEEQKARFFEVVVPHLPQTARNEINAIKDDDSLEPSAQWEAIAAVLESVYNSMQEEEKQALMKDIEESLSDYDTAKEEERRRTVIHKISIEDGSIEYEAKGEVKGYLLNQFSLDEHNGNLRVATTMETWTSQEYVQYNNVYVLDEDMNQIGSLEKIAPDERIYSARFMGDRLYMVTFKRIDPFFVIDLSGNDPKILGELKLPGYSDYLHPYDENHIIGIGKETGENEWGGVSTKGIKIALFDVSDVAKPKNRAVFGIGDAGTESEALHDHKAFLFDREKNFLVIPVREVKGEAKYDRRYGYYRQNVWQGAYAITLTLEDGFSLRGKVTHNEGDEDQWGYYGSPSAVRRSLYMDDVLYTLSSKLIRMNDLENMDDLGEIKLPYEEPQQYPYPILYKGAERGIGVPEPAVASSAPSPIDE